MIVKSILLPQLLSIATPVYEDLTLSDLFRQAGPFYWIILAAGFFFLFLVIMNIINTSRACRSAPFRMIGELRVALEAGRIGETLRSWGRDQSPLSRSIRAGLGGQDGQAHLDRAAVLRAWSVLMERYQWWPRCLGAYGLILGVSTLAILSIEAAHFAVLFWNKVATAVKQPYMRDVVRETVERLLLLGGAGTVLFALSLASFLVFSLLVRFAAHRSTGRIVDTLGAAARDEGSRGDKGSRGEKG